jgi:hypothetical protein
VQNIAAKFAVTATLCCHAVTAKVELKVFVSKLFWGATKDCTTFCAYVYVANCTKVKFLPRKTNNLV